MIPADYITEWRLRAPWASDEQVEQDLILSRALAEIFSRPELAQALAFRGATALYKLCLPEPVRYSEDIDLVQRSPEPIGATLDALRFVLDPWLGSPRRNIKEGGVSLIYRMASEGPPALPMRLKVEINTREQFSVFGIVEHSFEVDSRWFSGRAKIPSFALEELLATKLSSLYQRKNGRDLFDLSFALERALADRDRILAAFSAYMKRSGIRISRSEFETNLEAKLKDPTFANDLAPLLASGVEWNPKQAARLVQKTLLSRL